MKTISEVIDYINKRISQLKIEQKDYWFYYKEAKRTNNIDDINKYYRWYHCVSDSIREYEFMLNELGGEANGKAH